MASKRIETLASQGRVVDVIKQRPGAVEPRKNNGVAPSGQVQALAAEMGRQQPKQMTVEDLAIAVWQRAAVQVVLHSKSDELEENAERIADRSLEVARVFHAAFTGALPERRDPFNERSQSAGDEPADYSDRVEPDQDEPGPGDGETSGEGHETP